jgi:pentatricopeptide repeat protein
MNNKRESAIYIILAISLLIFLTAASSPIKIHNDQHKTTSVDQDMTCAICGETNQFPVMASTSSSGYSDLDTRPAPVQRYSMWLWIRRCPNCGYCSSDIESAPDVDVVKEIIESDDYVAQLNNENYPELANSFLCQSIIEEELGESNSAAGSALYAAWVCDDEEGFGDQAVECRLKAIGLFEQTIENDSENIVPETVNCILIDLLRRVGEFDRARELCNQMLEDGVSEKIIEGILKYQLGLIDAEDTSAHSMGEIPDVETLFE